jgi:hypothetical protein
MTKVIWLQTPTVFWLGGGIISPTSCNDVNTDRNTHRAEPLVPEPSAIEIELAIEKLKSHKLPGIDQIPAELIQVGVRQFTVRCINYYFCLE